MSRTRARALVLVNWRGVFYYRYTLDRAVTALEGANGAGKTTVMIAAYVVLLPDMSRLRFTNLGETGATGGDRGIWGRLGDIGRPSYAAIDFELADEERLIAGVHLERKAEPGVELTTFMVTGLDRSVRMQDLMLIARGDSEHVPELNELAEIAARLGGQLKVFKSVKEYFTALFERGVTPLRLSSEEDRNKLNEMLRTSMTGGISRALTSELRSFLLKEEAGLADTLQRMRANLDACRRTRTEVQESRRLEGEIGGVFEAGHTMFAAAFTASKERAEEQSNRLAEARRAHGEAEDARRLATIALDEAAEAQRAAEARQGTADRALLLARDRRQLLEAALEASHEVARRRSERGEATASEVRARGARDGAAEALRRQREAWTRAQDDHARAADGLADLQRGLEALHRRAADHQRVTRLRGEAEAHLGAELGAVEHFEARLIDARRELEAVDQERREGERRLADAREDRDRFARVVTALRSIAGESMTDAEAHAVAVAQLRRQRDLAALADRAGALATEVERAQRSASRQAAAREAAHRWQVAAADEPGPVRVRKALGDAEDELARQQTRAREARERGVVVRQELAELEARQRRLTEREPLWRDLEARARSLAVALEVPVSDRATLDAARALAAERLGASRAREQDLSRARDRLHHQARELLASGGPFDPELLRLKDQLDAELLGSHFDDVRLEEAPRIEARLGHLSHALIVERPRAAARAVVDRPAALPSVWLMSREDSAALLGQLEAHDGEDDGADAWVEEGAALRVTRRPDHPVLGRRAREQRAQALHDEAEQRAREAEDEGQRRRILERAVKDGEALLAQHELWLAGDPVVELAAVAQRVEVLRVLVDEHKATAARADDEARAGRPRLEGLRELLAEAQLLDPPDHGERAFQLAEEHQRAVEARAEVSRCAAATRVLDEGLDVLRRLPLSVAQLAALGERVERLRDRRGRLDAAIEGLVEMCLRIEAFEWGDAPEQLRRQEGLIPSLQAQRDLASAALESARASLDRADLAHAAAAELWRVADARRLVAEEQLAAAERRLAEMGVVEPTPDAVDDAREEERALGEELRRLATKVVELAQRCAVLGAEHARAIAEVASRAALAEAVRKEAEPAIAKWQALLQRASDAGLVAGVGTADLPAARGYLNLTVYAHARWTATLERLSRAQGGAALIEEHGWSGEAPEQDAYLDRWLAIRGWLRLRLPAQVADVPDPREALHRLRDQLAGLEGRLEEQERTLRGESADVARWIDVSLRRARGQVDRLNGGLAAVQFGAIRAIRVRLTTIDTMERILDALRGGLVQSLLFQDDLPIEAALEEIFRRYGAGKSGGQRLLDYREYANLQVEIRRGSALEWEIANPTRLSTGEAIGVGAALMMVVLTEWERAASSLRRKRAHGSLRFLFLDEANRLSRDNLVVLFELCRNLELQLLIAAPEVANAGNNTTYRLVRSSEVGREDVQVSGRYQSSED